MNGKDEGFEQTTAIVEFDPIRNAIQAFRDRYGSRVFSVATADGFADAKAVAKEGRKALSELEKIRKKRKERALRRCQQVDGEARTLREGIGAIFDPLFQMVDAEEKRQEREREEAEQREATRVAALQLRIERLSPAIPYGAKSFQIVGILNAVRAVAIDDSFQEFEDDAYLARSASLSRLQKAFDQAKAEEDAVAAREAELAAERAESARLRDQIRASEQAAAAAAAVTAAQSGQLFPVDPPIQTGDLDAAAFCRSCLRLIEPGAIACECGWSMIPAEGDDGRPPLSTPGGLKERIAAFDPPRPVDDLAGRLIRQAERNVAAADPDAAAAELDAAIRDESAAIVDRLCGAAPDQPKRKAPVTADYFDDRANDCVRICGITYSGDFFRAMADTAIGGWFRVARRDGSRIDCYVAPEECWIAFDEAAGVQDQEGGPK